MQYNYKSYLECMQGIILEHNYDNSYHSTCKDYILKILVNHPFNAEISIIMNTDTWNKYVNYSVSRNWRGFLDNHPKECNSMDFYCNPQEGKFYMGSSTDDKNYSVWEETTLEKIVNISRLAWEFSRHIHTDYNRLHAGQTCEFYAYAIDNNDRLYKPSTIEDNFPKYKWIYNPLTFKAHDITSESIEHLIAKTPPPKLVADKIILNHIQEFQHSKTNGLNIDGLVKEIRPSRECLKQLLESYEAEDQKTWVEKWKKRWQGIKSSPERFRIWLDKYDKMMIGLGGLIVGVILATFAILTYFKN